MSLVAMCFVLQEESVNTATLVHAPRVCVPRMPHGDQSDTSALEIEVEAGPDWIPSRSRSGSRVRTLKSAALYG